MALPTYHDIDGFRLSLSFTPKLFRSALKYEPKPEDIFIVTYPKCGTTWMQQLVLSLIRRFEPFDNPLDFHKASPFLELVGAEATENMLKPGAIKCHLPFNLTPFSPVAKYIYIARNPKDCCISFYHHTRLWPGYHFEGSFNDFFELFIEGKTDYGDYFDNLITWHEHRDDPNVLFLTFEAMKKDFSSIVKRVANFLGDKHEEFVNAQGNLEELIRICSVDYMKEIVNNDFEYLLEMPKEEYENNDQIPEGIRYLIACNQKGMKSEKCSNNNFVRKGVVGDYKSLMSSEQCKRLDDKFKEKTEGTGIENLWKDI